MIERNCYGPHEDAMGLSFGQKVELGRWRLGTGHSRESGQLRKRSGGKNVPDPVGNNR